MNDMIYTGKVTDLNQMIARISWPLKRNALMILECFQNRWIDKDERENAIRFEKFDEKQNFSAFQTGRIFDFEKELFWSWHETKEFHIIYSGATTDLPELQTAETDGWEKSEQKYMLWGRKHETEPVFLELQIPRLLRYPFSCKKEKTRLALKLIEYRDKLTCQIQHYRFLGLEEA